jgi:hypothetical protein
VPNPRNNPDVMPTARPGATFVKREELQRLWRVLENVFVGNAKGVLNRDSLRLPDRATGAGVVLARVYSGSGTTHTCDLYGNGSGEAATELTVTVSTPNVRTGEAIPPQTWIWVATIKGTYTALGDVWL